MSEEERLARIDNIGVVGRVAPEHKVLMVETLRKKGDVVAMTGDGVNDAPAIKAADIGIAMGTGTQVAKNAGKMILTDDNFATIVQAVSEGRKLYDNMLKYIRFMLVALVTYVVTFLLASLLNIAGGQPFSAVQILWINFLITAPVGIALGLDKETPGLMKRLPRPRTDSIMTPRGDHHRRACRPVHVRGDQPADRVREDHYDKTEIGSTHRPGRVLPDAGRRRPRMPRPDSHRSCAAETFDNNTVNITILVEIALALLIARGGVLPSLLGNRDAHRPAMADRRRTSPGAVRPLGARQGPRAASGEQRPGDGAHARPASHGRRLKRPGAAGIRGAPLVRPLTWRLT